ncbi:MAG: hypothetical protein AB7S93_21570 [Xanthobacteraceae bacterium]
MTKYYVVYDRETGYVHRAGQCLDADLQKQAMRPADAVIEHDCPVDPNTIRVELATKSVVVRNGRGNVGAPDDGADEDPGKLREYLSSSIAPRSFARSTAKG